MIPSHIIESLKRANMKKNRLTTPPNWRQGQTIFNFLEWLQCKGYTQNQSSRMVDPFNIPDKEWNKLYKEFLDLYNPFL